jgi:FAD-dependent oxidoreductase domain-containing protein 1
MSRRGAACPPSMTKNIDVLVIGAGIIGCASAYYIKKNSPRKQVLIVDRLSDAAQGNTARSNAMFRNTFTSEDNRVMTDSSIDCYLSLERDGHDLGLRKTGYLWLMSERQLSRNEKHVQRMIDTGIEVRRMDEKQLSASLPSLKMKFEGEDATEAGLMGIESVAGALLGPKCGRLDPSKLARDYLTRFQALGGEFSPDTTVDSLILEPNKPLGIDGEPFVWQDARVTGVRTAGGLAGEIRADSIILCAGAWMNELLEPIGLDGHVKAKKRQLFALPAESSALKQLVHNPNFNELKALPFLILPKSGCFVKALVESNEFWVGCEDDLNREFEDIPDRSLENYWAEPDYFENNVYRIISEYLPDFAGARPKQMWAGLYAYNTLDYLPFAFRDESTGIVCVGGDSGSGIMKGDALGRITDAVYRGEKEAELFGGKYYRTSKIGFNTRDVEREEWIL